MAGLKELRTRIEAVKSTEKITSAMKMVAAARLRKAQILIDSSSGYKNTLQTAANRILADIRQEEIIKKTKISLPSMMTENPGAKKYLLLLFSSDKGLCGSYNSNINKFARRHIDELQKAGKDVRILCFGKKSYMFLTKHYPEQIIGNIDNIAKKGPDFAESSEIAQKILEICKNENADICEAVFAKFNSAISREIVAFQLFPIKIEESEPTSDKPINVFGDAYYGYEPNRNEFLERLLPMIFTANVFSLIVQSQASEHGARMSSMDNATRNAKDMISELTLRYNTIRQSAITTELIEIIAGAEAI